MQNTGAFTLAEFFNSIKVTDVCQISVLTHCWGPGSVKLAVGLELAVKTP